MHLLMSFISVIFLYSVALAEIQDESGVLVLTDANFNDVIDSTDEILVEFYAPWCTHCKALAPEYIKAAKALMSSGSKVKLAKLDATVETKTPAKYNVQGYPTLKFFKKGKSSEYNGGRNANEIVKWLDKRTGPSIVQITSVEECEKLSEKHDFYVLILSEDTTSSDYKMIEEVAEVQEFDFFHCTHPSIAKKYESKKDLEIIVMRNFDEPSVTYDGPMTIDDISKFLKFANLPMVTEFNEENASKIFGSDIKRQLIAFIRKSDSQYDAFKKILTEVAADSREKAHVVIIDVDVVSHKRILEYFGIPEEETPTYRVIELYDTVMKFKPDVPTFTVHAIREFLNDAIDRKIEPHLQSEEIPADWDKHAVKVLVGKNFYEVAKDESKSVFVEFYAPWCGHCKQLMPIWEQLAEEYKDRSDIIIAKMDATANELADIKIGSFPTIKFFPQNSDEVIDYSGDRTLDGFKKFIESHTEEQEENISSDKVKEEL